MGLPIAHEAKIIGDLAEAVWPQNAQNIGNSFQSFSLQKLLRRLLRDRYRVEQR